MASVPRHWVPRGRATVVSALALSVALALPASAETTPPEPSPAPTPAPTGTEVPGATATPTPSGTDAPSPAPSEGTGDDPFAYDGQGPADGDVPLSTEDVGEQVAEAEALADKILRDDKEIAAAVDELKRYSKKANKLLQRYAKARDEHDAAQKEADEAEDELERLRGRLSEGRKDLRVWAFDTYTQAGGYSDAMVLIDTLGRDPENAGDSAGDLSYLTDNRVRTVDLLREDTVTQATLTKKKERAEKRAKTAKRKAASAKRRFDDVIKDRKSRLDALRKEHAKELKDAGPLVNALLGVADPDAQDAQQGLQDALKEAGQDISEFDGAKACSDNEESYPNGQVPPSGLCPLLGAQGESLRPRAAAAFNAMSKAYARDTGQPICVTDSYRSFAEQVVVKQQRGGWAATPGKSNHGLGLALDLCGGINSFGHPAHLWMQQNAPVYGWFHPEWAASGGSLPEPWHWEFAG